MGIAIGLTGPNASGKGEAAALLAEHGFRYHSLSDVVRREATRLGRDHRRENLIEIGNRLRSEEGWGVLARRIRADLGDRDVIDSIRHPAEIEVLRGIDRFVLLGIDAPIEIRFERARARGRIGEAVDLDRFRRLEDRERSGPGSGAQQIDECMRLADARVVNDTTVAALRERIREALKARGVDL